jgi:hypothetical protein
VGLLRIGDDGRVFWTPALLAQRAWVASQGFIAPLLARWCGWGRRVTLPSAFQASDVGMAYSVWPVCVANGRPWMAVMLLLLSCLGVPPGLAGMQEAETV